MISKIKLNSINSSRLQRILLFERFSFFSLAVLFGNLLSICICPIIYYPTCFKIAYKNIFLYPKNIILEIWTSIAI